MKICHVSTAHNTMDTRILLKECVSLAKAEKEWKLHLFIPATENFEYEGVKIHALRKFQNRYLRISLGVMVSFFKVLLSRPQVVHFHDPEWIFAGLMFRLLGKKVVFDVHENTTVQILSKKWLPFPKLVARAFAVINWMSAKCFYLILAEYSYEEVYRQWTPNYEIVLNLPDLHFLQKYVDLRRGKSTGLDLLYIGSITFDRGIGIILQAMSNLKANYSNIHFHCVGPCDEDVRKLVDEEVRKLNLGNQVTFYGLLPLADAYQIAKHCDVGLSVLKPLPNYITSYSTKIFEYMYVGLPVITSHFPLYREVVEKYNCGVCVDPNDIVSLQKALEQYVNNPELIQLQGKNGHFAAKDTFNWDREEKKLIQFYKTKVLS